VSLNYPELLKTIISVSAYPVSAYPVSAYLFVYRMQISRECHSNDTVNGKRWDVNMASSDVRITESLRVKIGWHVIYLSLYTDLNIRFANCVQNS